VNVFSLDRHLIREYASFARSFTKIRANDIAEQVERIYTREHSGQNRSSALTPATNQERRSRNSSGTATFVRISSKSSVWKASKSSSTSINRKRSQKRGSGRASS
jgi:hypothetical protein